MFYYVIKNNKLTGLIYDKITFSIIEHHLANNELFLETTQTFQPIGIDNYNHPVYPPLTLEHLKQAKLNTLKMLFKMKIAETDYLLFKAIEMNTTPAELNPEKWQERLNLRTAYEAKEAALQAATTQEELDRIDINL